MSTSALNRNQSEILSLTGIRGIAAAGVLLAHLNVDLEQSVNAPKLLYAQLYVDLFFVLSGFVISYVYMSKASWSVPFYYKFYSARLARIYPLYICAFVVAAVLFYSNVLTVHSLPGEGPRSMIKQVLLLNAMPIVHLDKFLIFTSWSVSIEWYLYILLFPILVALKNIRSYLSSPLVLVLLSLGLAVFMYNYTGDVKFTRSWVAWFRGVNGFTIGWLVHYHYANGTKLTLWCKKYCNLLMIAWVLIILISPHYNDKQPWAALVISPFLLLGLCYPGSASSRIMSTKWAVFLGDISYSVYLLHPLILVVLKNILPSLHVSAVAEAILHCVLGTILTLVISTLSYKYLERPCRNWIQKKLVLNNAWLSRQISKTVIN